MGKFIRVYCFMPRFSTYISVGNVDGNLFLNYFSTKFIIIIIIIIITSIELKKQGK